MTPGWAQGSDHCVRLLAIALLLIVAGPAMAQSGMRVDWKDGQLSVWTMETPLTEVLTEVARRTGLRIVGAEELRDSVTLGFSDVLLEDGLRRLLGGVSYVIVEPGMPHSQAYPTEVWVLGRGGYASSAAGATGPRENTGGELGSDAVASEVTVDDARGGRLQGFLADPDPAVRRFAVERLGEVGEPWARSRLVTALHDESPGVREKAVTALGEYGPEAADPVMMLLQFETHPDVRVAEAEFLGRIAEPRVAGVLEGMLVDADPRVRRAAVEALAHLPGAVASHALRIAALDQDVAVRTAALDGLGIFGAETDPRAAIEDALARNNAPSQAAAADLVGPLGQLGFLESPSQQATVSVAEPELPSEPR